MALDFLINKHHLNIKHIIKDQDNKCDEVLEKYGLKESLLFDPNHVLKSIRKGLENLYLSKRKDIKSDLIKWKNPEFRKNIFRRILIHIKFCVEAAKEKAPEKKLMMNVISHLCDEHGDCSSNCQDVRDRRKEMENPPTEDDLDVLYPFRTRSGKERKESRRIFDKYLSDEYDSRLSKLMSGRSTQLNESFNALISKYASKTMNIPKLYPARVYLAVRRLNKDEETFYNQICPNELSEDYS